jgi:proliferating cell nuclear antigen
MSTTQTQTQTVTTTTLKKAAPKTTTKTITKGATQTPTPTPSVTQIVTSTTTPSQTLTPKKITAPTPTPDPVPTPSNKAEKESEYLLEINTVQVTSFKGTLEAVKELVQECNIHFDKQGMKIRSVDGTHVALVHVRFDKENFEKYYCERDLSIGVYLPDILKVLKNVSQNDTLQLFVKKDNYDEAIIRIQNADKGCVHEFNIRLLDLDDDDIEIPETEFPTTITMPSSDLHSLCKQYKEFATQIDIKSVGNQVIFKFQGEETDIKGTSCLQNNDSGTTVQKVNDDGEDAGDEDVDIVQAKFMLKYLVIFTRAYSLTNTVEILLKNNYPIVLKYDIADLGQIKFCLAPIVEDDK